MPARRRVPLDQGVQALQTCRDAVEIGELPRDVRATAVRYSLEELADRAPGRTVEVRVPPFGAVQCLEGPRHTRGTPPNVVETDSLTWLMLATGRGTWLEASEAGSIRASGQRADLSAFLPLTEEHSGRAGRT